MPKYMKSEARFESVKAAERKKRSGSIGCSVRSSQATNAAMSSPPTAKAVRISGDAQPCSLPRIRAHTMPKRPPLTSPSPGRSSLVEAP